MNGAIIGFGTIARGHMHAYQSADNLCITGIVDSCEASRNYAQQSYPGIKVYATLQELLKEQKPEFIDICTPPDSHLQYIRLGLLANCHVLCEKPFLTDAAGYAEIISFIEASGKQVYPSHNYKFAPVLKWLKDQVQSSAFGQVKKGYFRTLRKGHARGVMEWNPHWRRDPAISSGGIIWDHGPHSIYLACYLLGQYPVRISCVAGNFDRTGSYADTEDTAMITLFFEDGTEFLLNVTWESDYRSTHYEVIGSRQVAMIDNNNILINRNGVYEDAQISSAFDDPSHKAWFSDMFNDFLNLIENPERQMDLLKEAFVTTVTIQKAYESAANRGKILELALGLPDKAVPEFRGISSLIEN